MFQLNVLKISSQLVFLGYKEYVLIQSEGV